MSGDNGPARGWKVFIVFLLVLVIFLLAHDAKIFANR